MTCVEYYETENGLHLINILPITHADYAYSDMRHFDAGCWGITDEEGNVLVEPQFMHYYDLKDGRVIFTKGRWVKGYYEDKPDKYWYEEDKWGVMDYQGNILVPFEFDEIGFFNEDDRYITPRKDIYKVRIGKYPDCKWGVIDNRGNWVVEPIFGEIEYGFYRNGEIIFWGVDHSLKQGVYDIINNKVVLEPIYEGIEFFGKDLYLISYWEGKIESDKVIDRTGREVFDSRYNGIFEIEGYDYYEVLTYDEHGNHRKICIIDLEGNVIVEPSEELFEKYAVFERDIRELVEEKIFKK